MPTGDDDAGELDVTVDADRRGRSALDTIIVDDTAGDQRSRFRSPAGRDGGVQRADELDIGTFCVNQPTTPSNVALRSTGTATIGLAAPALTPERAFDLD